MLLIPAIDLQNGNCVRLRQGDMRKPTVFSHDPPAMAAHWAAAGARRLHIVDLDGAQAGRPVNAELIGRIAQAHPQLPIQVGGGIRTAADVETYLNAGVQYIILGTRAITSPAFVRQLCADFPNKIIIGLDAKNGMVATDGWTKLTKRTAIEVAKEFASPDTAAHNAAAIIYTDILRDGMLRGINIESTRALSDAVPIPVIASGGMHNMNDITQLAKVAAGGLTQSNNTETGIAETKIAEKKIGTAGIIGAITGRAIYTGDINFTEAQKAMDEIVARDAN